MKIINLLKLFFKRILKKNNNIRLLDTPKETESKIIEKRERFKDCLKVKLYKNRIVSMQCINDGLGIQKIKNN